MRAIDAKSGLLSRSIVLGLLGALGCMPGCGDNPTDSAGAAGEPGATAGSSGSHAGGSSAAGASAVSGSGGNSAGTMNMSTGGNTAGVAGIAAGTGGGDSGGGVAGGLGGGSAGVGGGVSGSSPGGAASGGTGGGRSDGPCAKPIASTSTRPQLTDAEAANYTIAKYLAQTGSQTAPTTDPWDPTVGLGNASSFTADFTVASDGSGTHKTVQAALSAVSGSARRYILVKPGTYREQVSYMGSTPVTLYGASTDAKQVTIVFNQSSQEGNGRAFNLKSNGFQFMNLTISNDFMGNSQALALFTNGDKIVLQNVRLYGFQDTVQLSAPSATTIARVYIKDSFIEGDVDYIYGNARVVLEGTTINLAMRRGSGVIFAPNTSVDNPLGMLAVGCTFTGGAAATNNATSLGRSWDSSAIKPTPNGQAVIRNSVIGAHIKKAAPWAAAATSARPYSASGNRFFEYCNSGPGAGP